jgi:hypothetical protein
VPLPSFADQTITVIRPTWTDDHGTTVADWTTPTEHDVAGCSVQPLPGTENLAHRDAVSTLWRLIAPVDADLLDTDRVRAADGQTYEVTGSIQRWLDGVNDHVDAELTRVEG